MNHKESGGCCHGAASEAPHTDAAQARGMQRRLGVCVALALPLWVLHVQPLELAPPIVRGVQMVFGTAVVAWGAAPFFAWGRVRLNMFTLVSMSIGVAWALSMFLQLQAMLNNTPVPEVFFETAATITVIVWLGQVLETRARQATGTALRSILACLPPVACRVQNDGTEARVPVSEVLVGEHVRVRAHERIPVDGVVYEGQASIDASWVSGESMPRACEVGDHVVAGTLNGPTSFVVQVDSTGDATVLAQVQRLVQQAQSSRAKVQRLADKVSAVFVPVILGVACLTGLVWWQCGGESFASALVRAATVCIVACPCALGLATPVAVAVAVGRAATHGIVIREAAALETLARVDTLVVDKTGTLTVGAPRIATVVPLGDMGEDALIQTAATLEQASTHPLARALLEEAKRRGLGLGHVQACEATPGVGLRGRVDGRTIWLGKPDALGAQLLVKMGVQERLRVLNAHGQTLMLLLVDDKLEGVLGAADALRDTTLQALSELRAEGLELVMLTGDNQAAALMVADTLNIGEVHADMLPQDKLQHIQRLQKAGKTVAMAGDGVNDAPALAQADVGLALAHDDHLALPQAGINLMHADLRGICTARRLSVATLRVVRQNLVLAFAYNIIAVPAAAGVFSALGFTLSPVWASVAMGASSLLVVGNALRLRHVKK